ncbi:3-beta hydroxysteroid dehydrogenase/isomerase family-domain-containing protein [Mycena polygramma]|nr:3-beta hydroxysteroid dehydrogenase/isomerase family-domain-containing protein [Mycena polygramma]
MSFPAIPTHESYLVIGGGICLGEIIVENLLRRGETRVAIFDAQPLAAAQAARFGANVRVCVGDVLEPESIAAAVKSCATTCIIHVGMVSTPAGIAARYPTGPQPPFSLVADRERQQKLVTLHRKINTDGMRNVLGAALESGCETVTQLVYIGNPDVVFDGRDRPMLREANAPYPAKVWDEILEPQSQAERMVRSFNGVNALRTTVIRPAMLFGPGCGMVSIMRRIQSNPRIAAIQFGDNNNLVDRTYVANAAHAAILAADRLNPAHPQHQATAGNAFFITNGDPRPFWDFLRDLWTATGGAVPTPIVGGKGAMLFVAGVKDVVGRLWGGKTNEWNKTKFLCVNRTYDISLAREVLGYSPVVSHDEGIRRVAEWWLEYQLKICKEKTAIGNDVPPPYDHEEATLLAEKSPFF